ncbi:sulfotransferase 1E1-like [Pieris napi]|uniref:sulfotransferase 1E1-like n=1 Tax=Pieris napi TaxID=78633 RepID=UPI001FBAF42F|nr:sulfotransferase 1E1-like [Pieris napi]
MEKYRFPYDIEDFKDGRPWDSIRVGPKRYVVSSTYRDLASEFYNFELRPDDVFLLGFPRSGTTRCQEAIWLINNNLDYEKSKSIVIDDRCPFLDLEVQFPTPFSSENSEFQNAGENHLLKKVISPLKSLPNAPSPRFIKSHLPLSLLPPNLLDTTKVVYIARDPRDVAVSYYYLMKHLLPNDMGFEKYWGAFRDDKILLTPIFEHIKEAWGQRDHPNMVFLTYEDMSKDMASTLRQMCEFFGKKYSEEQIRGLCEHLSFDKFKTNKSVNGEQTVLKTFDVINDSDCAFIRKGKVGGWEDYFNSEQLKESAKRWMSENLAGTDLPFSV